MFVFILSLFSFINTLDPTQAFFENGDIGSGINNRIGIQENVCIKRYNLNLLSKENLCNFEIIIKDIKNRWENGKYIVKVVADLSDEYLERTVNNRCVISVFNKCISFKEVVTEKNRQTEWEYTNQYRFNDNPAGSTLKFLIRELSSEYRQVINIFIPQAKYPVKDFVLPIEDKFVVTQEFGNTDFSKNHTGMDFGVKKVKVLSVSDGVVEYTGDDITSSICNNGGKIVRIRHDNQLYSAYFHLDKIKVNQGEKIEKGQVIGISGNSGQYNCKPMGFHLHFELRDGALQKDVINPRAIFSSI